MIKKTITVLSMLILSTSLMWAVWEGNAAMGAHEEFPSGLFASSDVFPKYTLIEISNLEQNTKSRAVIIGNTGSDGLLLKVSPDLAKALAIKAGSTVRVRVSIPPLVAEEGADPVLFSKAGNKQPASSVSSKTPEAEDADIISEEVPTQDDSEKLIDEQPVQTEPVPAEVSEPIQPVTETAEETVEPATVAEVEEPEQPEAAPEEPVVTIAEVVEPVLPEPENLPSSVSEVSEPILHEPESTPVPAAVSDAAEPILPSVQTEDSTEDRPVLTVAPMSKQPEQEGAEVPDEYTKPVPEVSTPIEPQPIVIDDVEPEKNAEELIDEPDIIAVESEETEPDHIDKPEPVVAENPEETTDTMVADEPEPEENKEEPTDEPELLAVESDEESAEPQDEPEIVAAAALPEEDNSEDESVEQHAILVPSEPRAPNSEDLPLPKEKPVPPAAPVVTQPAEELYTASALTKGAFYVQVGRFKDILNVESFVQMYGKRYPVTIEKSSTADVFYKVYVGPLKKDERGATLETFQKLGFKDAFLKKAP